MRSCRARALARGRGTGRKHPCSCNLRASAREHTCDVYAGQKQAQNITSVDARLAHAKCDALSLTLSGLNQDLTRAAARSLGGLGGLGGKNVCRVQRTCVQPLSMPLRALNVVRYHPRVHPVILSVAVLITRQELNEWPRVAGPRYT